MRDCRGMNQEAEQPLTRRALTDLTDPRTIRMGASLFYPALMAVFIGVSRLLVNAGLTALAVWPARHAHPPVYLFSVFIFFVVGLPVLYFVLGGRYGLTRAAFSVYE